MMPGISRFMLSAVAAGTFFVVGCTSVEGEGAAGQAPDESAPANQPQIELCKQMLETFRSNAADAFVQLLPENLRATFGKNEFIGARKSLTDTLGEMSGYRLLTELKHPLVKVYIWQVGFARKSGDGKEIEQEILLKAIISDVDGKPQIISFVFI